MLLGEDYEIIDAHTADKYETWKSFLGRAIRDAERAHTGKGIWDIALMGCNDDEVQDVLGEASVSDPASHFHLSRMSIVVHKPTGTPVASAGGFHFPTCRVRNSQAGITAALLKLHPEKCSLPAAEAHRIWDRISFLDDSFPDYDYDDTWMIDAVYTDPNHRGKGLAEAVVSHVLTKGKEEGYKRSLITCGVGNEKARRVYERCGYKLVGQGESAECFDAIGYVGFYLLEKYL